MMDLHNIGGYLYLVYVVCDLAICFYRQKLRLPRIFFYILGASFR